MRFIYFHACFSSREGCGSRVHDFSVWSTQSGRFRLSRFGHRTFPVLVVPVSRNFSQAMKSCRSLICSLFNTHVLKSTKGFI